ncbi:hypothetical protein M409DRAFT_18702 [Zasmidium cellare ATCC 36951]|uniref:Uncharacterized protein n=1 Tax=Zasmidium cellare ATCC 36951 TaxID=1080233 RepID=A0A6A6CX16_ZASCE|nr:uncharacterized protein M409DRAFT_18702 [Zasmidium cellare ATCC 36951]KAF2170730.1 hypothetical protein M409DRAFT_18702 [Zasmidium cellare ATCC 36951]
MPTTAIKTIYYTKTQSAPISLHPSTKMSTLPTIPAVLIGITRTTALSSSIDLFTGTPYSIAAVLDLHEAPEKYQFSLSNLGTVLYALHPRPRILGTGTAIEAEMVEEIESVWGEHVGRVEGRCCWVALSKTHGRPGPPPPGIGEEVMRQLDAVFRPEVKHS